MMTSNALHFNDSGNCRRHVENQGRTPIFLILSIKCGTLSYRLPSLRVRQNQFDKWTTLRGLMEIVKYFQGA
jgi:hypothetical protein